jgi:hypothetical protein
MKNDPERTNHENHEKTRSRRKKKRGRIAPPQRNRSVSGFVCFDCFVRFVVRSRQQQTRANVDIVCPGRSSVAGGPEPRKDRPGIRYFIRESSCPMIRVGRALHGPNILHGGDGPVRVFRTFRVFRGLARAC